MLRLALTAAVLTAVFAGCAGSAPPAADLAMSASSDQLANVQQVETIVPPTTAPAPPPDPAVLAREAAIRARAERASRAAARPRPAVHVGGDVWGALARCESGGNPRAVGGGGRYFGAFQFSLGTWHSLGYGGNPVDYDYGTQLAAAQRLVARGGWRQFPACSRRLGLR
jgi:hypothetical protein